jgi:KUP system potassium uptake protein
MTKLDEGGWVSLLIAALISTCMLTWKRGREILMQRLREKRMTLAQFIEQVREKRVYRTEGTAVFMTSDPNGLPVGLFQNFLLNHVVHQQVIIMNVQFEEIPFIPVQNRIQISNLGENFHFVTVHYGFMQTPNIPRIIEMCRFDGVPVNKDDVTYFFGRETIIATDRVGMQKWRERLFILMSRNSQTAMEFFKIPTDKVVEFGIQVEI